MDHDDRQLLLATHRGHEASARLLWDRHGARLLAHARCILRDSAAAEDAVQTVLCRLMELPRARITAVEDVPAFLAASTRREALNALRSSRREQSRRRARAAPAAPAAAPPDSRHKTVVELGPEVDRALASLPRHMREVVILKHISDLTFDQIASALATNRNTIASRYRSAMATLRSILDAPDTARASAPPARSTQGAAYA